MIDYVTHTSNRDRRWDAQAVTPEQITVPCGQLRGHDWHRNGKELREAGYATDLIRDEALRRIRQRNTDKPLFLYIPFTAPHTPLQAKEEDLEPYRNIDIGLPRVFQSDMRRLSFRQENRRHLAAMVSGMDRAIGDILGALKEAGMTEDTIVIFLSDNGGSYQGGNNDPLRSQKMLLYEGGVRVPALLSFPGRIRPGTLVRQPLHVVDLYPTLLRLAGASLEQPLPLDGIDAWAIVSEGRTIPEREILLNAREGRSSAIRIGDWKLVKNGHLGPINTIGNEENRHELFHPIEDAGERIDLATSHPQELPRLRKRLEAYLKEAVPPLYQPPPATGETPAGCPPHGGRCQQGKPGNGRRSRTWRPGKRIRVCRSVYSASTLRADPSASITVNSPPVFFARFAISLWAFGSIIAKVLIITLFFLARSLMFSTI